MAKTPRFDQLAANAKEQVREVTAADARAQQEQGAILMDVREIEEFARDHAAGALHLSRGVLELRIEQHVPEVTTPVLCYCGGGSRSALAAESLQKMGYTNVASVAGGFKAWRNANLPVES